MATAFGLAQPTKKPRYKVDKTSGCAFYPARSYVLSGDLKSGDETSEHWMKRGTAILVSLEA